MSANLIGLLMANVARFFLFRTYVFQRKPLPFHLHLTHEEVEEELSLQRSVHERPSSASRSLTSGRLRPTTLWWSPSIPVTNAPPRPSTVNAPATCSGSPVATYAAISSSVTSAKWTVVDAVAAATLAGRGVAQAVTGVEHAGAAAHRLPAPGRLVGVVRLAERLAVELEHRVAAEHDRVVGQVVALRPPRRT